METHSANRATSAPHREPMTADPNKPCPTFYAFGAPYPDGDCHDGHLCDGDSDSCSLEYDYKPCPNCNNAEYLRRLKDGGDFTPPFGYVQVVPGDYFALPPKQPKKLYGAFVADLQGKPFELLHVSHSARALRRRYPHLVEVHPVQEVHDEQGRRAFEMLYHLRNAPFFLRPASSRAVAQRDERP